MRTVENNILLLTDIWDHFFFFSFSQQAEAINAAVDKYLLNKNSVVKGILSPENNHFKDITKQLTFQQIT